MAHFSRKCARLLQWVVFFRHEKSTFLFICSTTSNLNNFKPQQLQPQKRVQNTRKNKTDVHNLENTLKIPPQPHFFRHYATFFEVFWIAPEGPPFICFYILQHNGCQKIAKGPPFTVFGTVTLQKSHLKIFFGKFFHVSKGSPLQFFKFFATSWSFTKPEGSPFQILSLRYGANFGRSRLVSFSADSLTLNGLFLQSFVQLIF